MNDAATIQKPSVTWRFLGHLAHMPAWHRYVLIVAIGMATIGAVGHMRQFIGAAAPSQGGTITTPHSNFAAGAPTDSAVATDTTSQPWYLSPRFLGIGGSVLGGFLIGWAMRVFVKTTLLAGLAVAALFSGLSYFRVMNIDLTSVHQRYSGDMSWLSDQAWRLKGVAIAHLPVHAGGLFGAFLGFRRPRL